MDNNLFRDTEIPENTREEVNRAVKAMRLPQSVLLSGGSEKLREKCIKDLCAAALCGNITRTSPFPCGKCASCRKVEAGVHPDVIRITPDAGRKTISVDNIRKQVIATVCEPPNEAPNKVYILPGAGDYSAVIQNALLKSIEEPPEYVMFILESEQRETLLTTIISRVTEYHLGDTLTSKSRKEDEKVLETAKEIINSLIKDDEYGLMLKTAPMQKNRKLVSAVAVKIITAVRDALCEESGAELLSGLDREVFLLSSGFDAASLIKIKEHMDMMVSDAAANANENLLLSRFCSGLAVIQKERRT